MASKKPEYASMAANRRHFNHTTDVRVDSNSSSGLNQECKRYGVNLENF